MKKLLAILIIFALVPIFARAATISLEIDTGSENINALEATVSLPTGAKVAEIRDGGSMILIWIKPPEWDEKAHTISFTGLTPGGFRGKHLVFTFSGDFDKSTLARASVSNILALRNDGKGTQAKVKLTLANAEALADITSPESFTPEVGTSPNLFGDKPFLSFLSKDTVSGVDHYEYAATWLFRPGTNDWQKAESPLLLPSSDYRKTLYIRAVDREGNVRVGSVMGPKRAESILISGIIIVSLLCVLYLVRRFFLAY